MRRALRPVLASLLLVILGSAVVIAADSDGDGLQDAFEERWGISSPAMADTDGDGLIDAAEDQDGDRLGALGEQRYGTDPGAADTDGDGIDDGAEDFDGDGVDNASQQDQRRAPPGLRPKPKAAYWDRPASYDDECHNDQLDTTLNPCEHADTAGDVTIVLFGDSHALQWLPALTIPATEEGWRVVNLTKAACPPAEILSGRKDPQAGVSCERWRKRALDWLAVEKPEVAVLAGGGRIYNLVDESGERLPEESRTPTWLAGLTRTLEAMPAETSVIVLADTPFLKRNPATCLEDDDSDLAACSTPRAAAIDLAFDRAEREATEAAGAIYADFSALVCPYGPCPVVIGDVLVYRNADHITQTYAEQLVPSMWAVLRTAVDRLDASAEPDGSPSASAEPAEEG